MVFMDFLLKEFTVTWLLPSNSAELEHVSEFITKPRHSKLAEGSGLLGSDTVSLDERFPTF